MLRVVVESVGVCILCLRPWRIIIGEKRPLLLWLHCSNGPSTKNRFRKVSQKGGSNDSIL